MKMIPVGPDTTLEDAVRGVVQGNEGAHNALANLKQTFPREDWLRMVRYLYEYGPRGEGLEEKLVQRCGSDVLILGKDLLSQSQEFSGWKP